MKVPRGWLPLGLLLAGGAVALVAGPRLHPAAHAQTPTPAGAGDWHIAVVDYQSLLKNHPEFEKLKQVDEHLGLLKDEKENVGVMDALTARDSSYKKMQDEVKKARAEMEAEKAQVEGEMAGLASSLQGEMNAELNRLKAGYDAEIQAMVRKLGPPPSARRPEAAPVMPNPGASMTEYQQGLMLVRQRNLTARRLELEKSIRAEIEAERARFDQQMAAHEDQIASQYQEEKLNLQLKLQVTQDEAEQQQLQERLSAISEEISTKKAAKRAELEGGFNQFRDRKNGEFESQMSSYKRKLDDDVARQMGGYRPPPPPSAPTQPKQPEAPPPQEPPKAAQEAIKRKIEEAQSVIKSRMAAKEAELRGAMEAKAEQARGRLMAKQKEIQERLDKTQEQLKDLFEQQKKNRSTKSKAKVEALGKQIEKLQKEREELYDRMIGDINKVVGEVAQKKDVPMVVGQVLWSDAGKCQDLTDFSMVGVKQLGSH